MATTQVEAVIAKSRGKCLSCGFLAKQGFRPSPPGFYEASIVDRTDGTVWTHQLVVNEEFRTLPTCFRAAYNLSMEID